MTNEAMNAWLDTTSEITGESIRKFLDQAGYVIVPKRATSHMVLAAGDIARDTGIYPHDVEQIWQRMVSAAR